MAHGTRTLIWETELAGFPIKLEQFKPDHFSVTYGKEEHALLSYAQACAFLGKAILHALACEGKVEQ